MDINLEMQAAKRKSGLFYGWWVILGACLGYTASSSMNWVTSMVFPQLQKEMGWTAADLGFLLAATVWLGLLWAPFGGWLCDRIGNRWAIIVGLLIAGGAVLIYTTVHQIWQLFIFYPILTGIGVQIAGQIGSMSLPRKWFIKRSALVAGVIGGFWGITSSLIFPAVTELAASKGWRQTIFIMVPTIIIIAIAVIFFVVRDSPEKKGLHPDGVPDVDWQSIQASRPWSRTVAEHNLTRSQALRTPQFWLIAFSYGVTLASLTIVQGNATLMAEWVGIPLSAAGTAMTALMIPAIFSRILVGIMGDRFGKKKVLVFTAACNVVIFFAGWLLV
jgi:MFS family permease